MAFAVACSNWKKGALKWKTLSPPGGNAVAQTLIADVFRVVRRRWRGIGEIPQSGLALSERYAGFDAELRFGAAAGVATERSTECISGRVLQGFKKPHECRAFGNRCTPEHPRATMVSSEGACAAYYRYRRFAEPSHA